MQFNLLVTITCDRVTILIRRILEVYKLLQVHNNPEEDKLNIFKYQTFFK